MNVPKAAACNHRNWYAWTGAGHSGQIATCMNCGTTFPKPERPPEPPKLRRIK